MNILGISAYYHDSSAALVIDGKIIAAAQEERFTRIKQDANFPVNAVEYVLSAAKISIEQVDLVVFYDNPILKNKRILRSIFSNVPHGVENFVKAALNYKQRFFLKKIIREELGLKGDTANRIIFSLHHLSHAASAFYPSPFARAAFLTIDGVGEMDTTLLGVGDGNSIRFLKSMEFPHSLGLFYSAVTQFCGFKVNSGEYKLMGLAPYGNAGSEQVKQWRKLFLEHIIHIKNDGSYSLNMDYFEYARKPNMCCFEKWEKLFVIPARKPESEISQEYMNLAMAAQLVTEEAILAIVRHLKALTGENSLVLAGGVALNCVANGKIMQSGIFDNIWIQPAAGDAGGALGAALAAWHVYCGNERTVDPAADSMYGAYLGCEFEAAQIEEVADDFEAPYSKFTDFSELCATVSRVISEGKVVGWFQGRMEFGPRALGNRSIIADPRNTQMQKNLNLKIKFREGFRPFAPSVLYEDRKEYFDLEPESPYMLIVTQVADAQLCSLPDNYEELPMYDRLYIKRSAVPAITHVDLSARVQTVKREVNPRYWDLLSTFKEKYGCGSLVNTSFNVRGEPIVCTPEDAYICFMRTNMDYLVINDYLFVKSEQPELEDIDWEKEFELD